MSWTQTHLDLFTNNFYCRTNEKVQDASGMLLSTGTTCMVGGNLGHNDNSFPAHQSHENGIAIADSNGNIDDMGTEPSVMGGGGRRIRRHSSPKEQPRPLSSQHDVEQNRPLAPIIANHPNNDDGSDGGTRGAIRRSFA